MEIRRGLTQVSLTMDEVNLLQRQMPEDWVKVVNFSDGGSGIEGATGWELFIPSRQVGWFKQVCSQVRPPIKAQASSTLR